ncbi:MAG TPA: anti-sigma factor antagonist [Planctomycetes bacterium]|nr:anti-sigma factor antagonist [Planctomycetota bacterium]
MPGFSIKTERLDGKTALVEVQGFLDAHTFERLEEEINGLFAEGTYRLVVDIAGVDYISSAGAGVFIGSVTEAQENGGDIVLVNPTANVLDVFDLLGLTQIFTICKTKEEALGAFK